MDSFYIARVIGDFLIGFSTLFTIINPFGMAFVFVDRTRALTEEERVALAWRIARYSFVLLVVSILIGTPILTFFGIDLPALRVAGGFVVALAGYAMLTEPEWRDGDSSKTVTPITVSGMAFFPLTLPLTVGPGTIAASIALGAQPKYSAADYAAGAVSGLLIAASVSLTVLFFYRYAASVARFFGPEGARIVTRLTAFLLLCIGVQIMMTGTAAWLSPMLAQRAP
ncbi:MarC family protein [Roseomonas rosulenta]|uniref:MarC family protein n=1 Tax=Roseomonas rosulenta TaxID=2748667 RepID=UPI0018DEF36F|nr:MarC family protein [Roseomonas rosulenta]